MRRVPVLTATSYQTTFSSGRTTPYVLACEDLDGAPAGEYVVKLRSNIDSGNMGLLGEIICNLLADQLGIDSPQPAIIKIDADFAGAVTDEDVSDALRKSAGLNFGSLFLAGGYVVWPQDKMIPKNLRQAALDIFVFDALIQNPDRRREKPNLLWKKNQLVVIDHETAFSFLLAILPSTEPWFLEDQPYLDNHIFFRQLKHTEIGIDQMAGAIENVTPENWNEFEGVIPDEWKGAEFERIKNHIGLVQEHLDEFVNNIRRILA